MKHINREKNQSAYRILRAFGTAAFVMAFAVACNKGGGGSANPPAAAVNQYVGPNGGPIFGQCGSCNGANALLASGTGQTFRSGALEMELSLDLYGQGYTSQTNTQQTNGLQSYNGTVAAQGTLRVFQPSTACGVPAGDYSIVTTQAGQWNGYNHSFSNLMLQANGPAQVVVLMQGNWIEYSTPASVTTDGRQFPYRLQNSVTVYNPNYQYISSGYCIPAVLL